MNESGRQRARRYDLKNRQNEEPAVDAFRRTLVGAARRQETMTYGTLMRKFGLSRGRALSAMIAEADRREQASGAPGFAAIIVRKDTGHPGGGYFCDDELPPRLRRLPSRCSDPRLTESEKDYVRRQQKRIWAFYARASR